MEINKDYFLISFFISFFVLYLYAPQQKLIVKLPNKNDSQK